MLINRTFLLIKAKELITMAPSNKMYKVNSCALSYLKDNESKAENSRPLVKIIDDKGSLIIFLTIDAYHK